MLICVISPWTSVKNGQITAASFSTYVRLVDRLRDYIGSRVRYEFINALDENYLRSLIHSGKFNTLLIQRNAIKNIDLVNDIINLKIKVIYEIDDDLVVLGKNSLINDSYYDCHVVIEKLLSYASIVTVSTDVLKSRFSSYNSNIVIVPNVINMKRWCSPSREYYVFENIKSTNFNVLYMGTNTHLEDLGILEKVVKQIKKDYPKFNLYVVGVTNINSDWYSVINIPKQCKHYPEFVKFIKALAKHMHLGVAPLEDGYFQQAKSCLKFLEYSALGLPSICSNVTPYKEVVKHGENGLLADNTTQSWIEQFEFVINNKQLVLNLSTLAYRQIIGMENENSFDFLVGFYE